MNIVVRTPARLHLGILDTNGNLGRLYGSIGVAIERPNVVLEAEPADRLLVEGLETERVATFARRFLDRHALLCGARLCLKARIPSHVGLGSGTQLALAVGAALARLNDLEIGVEEIAVATGRGAHSGIGIAAFEHGGFVLDGGRRVITGSQAVLSTKQELPRDAERGVPPVLFCRPFPEDWYFVVVVPEVEAGLSGEREKRAFQTLPPAPQPLVERISRLLLMRMLPALVEQDIASFGNALTEIQRLVGESFASVQGSRYAHTLLEQLIGFLLDSGAAGAGQSSWGPTTYALVEGRDQALRLESEARGYIECHGGGQTFCVRADNRGAWVEQIALDSVTEWRLRQAS